MNTTRRLLFAVGALCAIVIGVAEAGSNARQNGGSLSSTKILALKHGR